PLLHPGPYSQPQHQIQNLSLLLFLRLIPTQNPPVTHTPIPIPIRLAALPESKGHLPFLHCPIPECITRSFYTYPDDVHATYVRVLARVTRGSESGSIVRRTRRRRRVWTSHPRGRPVSPTPTLLHQAAEENIYLVSVALEGTLSRSSSSVSARNRDWGQTTSGMATGGRLQRSGSGKSKRKSASRHTRSPERQGESGGVEQSTCAWGREYRGTVKPVGSVDVPMEVVKAPKSVSVKDLEAMDTDSVKAKVKSGAGGGMFLPKAPSLKVEEDGQRRAGQSVLPSHPRSSSHPVASASTSTLTPAVPSSSTSLSTPVPARHDHVHFQCAPSPPSQSRKQVMPLKSALKGGSGSGGSRTPSPGTLATYRSTPSPPEIVTQLQPPQPPQHNTESNHGKDSIPNGTKAMHDEDLYADNMVSSSSYETGYEAFGGAAKTDGNGNAIVPKSAPQPVPQRRKSAPASLKSQFSSTPPAIEDDPEGMVWEVTESPTSTETPRQRQNSQKGRGYKEERDMWDDSSEEQEDN
ncbi:hypothetical protein V5O48_016546, partial [Marasmius crinis-equi]